eukprot:COSAG02_NODE_695_length_18407_cov_105.138573_2_plen_72_part_00
MHMARGEDRCSHGRVHAAAAITIESYAAEVPVLLFILSRLLLEVASPEIVYVAVTAATHRDQIVSEPAADT